MGQYTVELVFSMVCCSTDYIAFGRDFYLHKVTVVFLEVPRLFKLVGAEIVIPDGCFVYEDAIIMENETLSDCVFSCVVRMTHNILNGDEKRTGF